MRLYTFINFYLSSIQQGIQTAHILGEIVDRYKKFEFANGHQGNMVEEFLENHKTIICYNGGNAKSLIELHDFFFSEENPYPWSCFYEDADSLNCAMTGVGIILPEEIYEAVYNVDSGGEDCEDPFVRTYDYVPKEGGLAITYNEGTFEFDLIKRIKTAPLAR